MNGSRCQQTMLQLMSTIYFGHKRRRDEPPKHKGIQNTVTKCKQRQTVTCAIATIITEALAKRRTMMRSPPATGISPTTAQHT